MRLLLVALALAACGEPLGGPDIGDDVGGDPELGGTGVSGGGIDPGGAQDIAAAREIINAGNVPDGSLITVGGLLSKALGRVPIPGATAVVSGLELVAERPAGRRHRIATVLVREVGEGPDDDADEALDGDLTSGSAAARRPGTSDGAA